MLPLPSPAPHPHPRRQQYQSRHAGDDPVLGVHMRHAGLVSGKEARQLIRRHHEVNGGNNEQDDAEQAENELHG